MKHKSAYGSKEAPHRAVWLVALVGLGTGALMLATVSWSLVQIKTDRVEGDVIHSEASKAISSADDVLSSLLANSNKLLAGTTTPEKLEVATWQPPFDNDDVRTFDSTSKQQIFEAGQELAEVINKISLLYQDCSEFASRVHEDKAELVLAQKDVAIALRELRASFASAEGSELLNMAVRMLKYRSLKDRSREQFADSILKEWSPISTQGASMTELADLAMLCEQLHSEDDIDALVDLKDNRFQSNLSRLRRLVTSYDIKNDGQNGALLSRLEAKLFGGAFEYDRKHQTVVLGDGGLYQACQSVLSNNLEKEKLEAELRVCVRQFNDSRSKLLIKLDHVSRESAQRAAKLITDAWYTMAGVGAVLSLVFSFLATRVSSTIQNQFWSIQEKSVQLADKTAELEASAKHLNVLSLVAKHTDNSVVIVDEQGRIEWVNDGFVRINGYALREVVGRSPLEFLQNPDANPEALEYMRSSIRHKESFDVETIKHRKDGTPFWALIEATPIFNTEGKATRFMLVERDISARVNADLERQRLNERLVDASRAAGIAEMATGVLHNVGNVLNSVNVSATLIQRHLNNSVVTKLEKVSGLIADHECEFADFVKNDKRGQQVPAYIATVANALRSERDQMSEEFKDLIRNIEHIKQIVTAQQSMATSNGLFEALSPESLVRDAIVANKGALENHNIDIATEIADDLPEFESDKHKILQILINLIKNAKDALIENETPEPRIEVHVSACDEQVAFEVVDNGVGIPKDKIDKIFRHGFTTKQTGHGFGLHGSANSATQLGGSLSARSSGKGRGAAFKLSLPAKPSAKTTSSREPLDSCSPGDGLSAMHAVVPFHRNR